jgi:uncharacterized membrane protein
VIFELIVVLVIVIGTSAFLFRAARRVRPSQEPEQILKERFARGEITGTELEEGLQQLAQH